MTLRQMRTIAIEAYTLNRELVDFDYKEDEATRVGCLVLHKRITKVYKEVARTPRIDITCIGDIERRYVTEKKLWFQF